MRTLVRTLAAAVVLSALVLGSAASAVLAGSPSGNGASVERYDFDAAWCFDHGPWYDCTTVDATLFVTASPDGRDIARIQFREQVTSFDPSGVEIGSLRTVSFDRTVFADGGQNETFSVSHTRAVGELGTCVSTYILKIVDYEVQFEKLNGPLCG
jgi:hypothetical protein